MPKSFFLLLLLLVTIKPFAQPCKVMADSLQGKYTGGCKDGLASGQGTALGIGEYTGHFKEGYQDGTGKYSWKNGSWYEGHWKKGRYEGEGTLHLIGLDNISRDYAGFWHEGIFQGTAYRPYAINSMTGKISEVSIHQGHGTSPGDIIITLYDILNGAGTLDAPNGAFLPKQKMTNIQILEGNFTKMVTDVQSSQMNNIYELFGVVYPIRLVLTFQTEQADLEIFEKGKWDVFIKLEIMNSESVK